MCLAKMILAIASYIPIITNCNPHATSAEEEEMEDDKKKCRKKLF